MEQGAEVDACDQYLLRLSITLDLIKPELAAEKALAAQTAGQLAEWEIKFVAHSALLENSQRTAATQQARADILQSQLLELKTPPPRTRKTKVNPTRA